MADKPRPKYQSVNGQWPEGTNEGRDLKPTPEEAIAAAKRLYRFAFKKPYRGEFKITSGRNYTFPRWGVFNVNPDQRNGGWHELVHSMSHFATSRLYPNANGHGPQHAFMEREMIKYVVDSGWLDGKLRSKKKPKATVDPRTVRAARVAARIKSWEAKKRRAENALKKLQRSARYYEKQTAPEVNPGPS
jgi:hypothetical protein